MEGEYSQQDICNTWSLSKQTVNSIIQNMVQKDFVYLESVPGTRNLKKVHLTRKGKQYGENMITPIFNAENRTVSRIAEENWEFCTAVLNSYICIFEEEIYGTENKAGHGLWQREKTDGPDGSACGHRTGY